MSWLVWSACFDYLWLFSFFAPLSRPLSLFLCVCVMSCITPFTFHPHTHFFIFLVNISVCMSAYLCVYCMFFAWTFFVACGFFITTVGSCTSLRWCALQKIHYGGSGSRGPCIQARCPGAYSGKGMGFLCIYCNPGATGWLQPPMWSSLCWDAFSLAGSICVIACYEEQAKCAFETFHPLPLFSTVT